MIAKELAQVLCSENKATRSATPHQVVILCEALAKASRKDGAPVQVRTKAFSAEFDAVWLAAEILCPFEIREALLEKGIASQVGWDALESQFGVPKEYLEAMLQDDFHDIVSGLQKERAA